MGETGDRWRFLREVTASLPLGISLRSIGLTRRWRSGWPARRRNVRRLNLERDDSAFVVVRVDRICLRTARVEGPGIRRV
jgi:hypothetical protein